MALIVSYILESSHIEHVYSSIIRTSDDLPFRQFQGYIDSSGMILYRIRHTDENEADFAIFLTPEGRTFVKLSIKA